MLNQPVEIHVTPSWCYIRNASQGIKEILYEELKYKADGYFHSPRFQNGQWDGYNRMFYTRTSRFRIGLLSRVYWLLKNRGIDVKIINMPEPKAYVQKSFTYKLREYQREAVESMLRHRVGIIKAPPRSGKTMMFIAAIDSERQFPAIFFVRSLDLAMQTKARIEEFLPDVSVGIVGDGKCDIKDVTIVTLQSAYTAFGKKYDLKKRGDKTEVEISRIEDKNKIRQLIINAKQIFVDECHHAIAPTVRMILDKNIKSNLRIGLSATPFGDKADAFKVEERLGAVIYDISYGTLIKAGYILRPYIYLYKLPKTPGAVGTYQAIYKKAVIENEFLNGLVEKIVKKLNSMGKSVVIQTEFKKHTRDLAKRLGCEYLYGDDSTEKRMRVKKELEEKKILTLVSTLFEEGLDVPTLDYTINLSGGLEQIGVFQRMRSMTASRGKKTCGVIDFIFQDKYLSRHSKRRKKLYLSEPEFVVEIRDVSKKMLEEIQ